MNKFSFFAFALFANFTFYQCSAPGFVLSSPKDNELAAAQKRWPDVTKESFTQGYTIYTTKCTKCHGDKGIPGKSEADWGKYIGYMAPKANLTAAETETLTRYVYTIREMYTKK